MTKKSTLLIVESPAKEKTIEHYLGKGYSVEASVGQLIELPKSRIAIDVDHGFEPEYITVRGKASILKELEKKAAKADEVLLASDNDREGEAISYHLKCALESKKIPAKIERIIFNEITPGAIKAAVNAPRDIDMGKVNAQKARRVLDRIVGYNLSPILWKKVKNGLSAGRVQSVALRLICDREAEVQAFTPEEYWSLDVELRKGKGSFAAQLVPQSEEKITFHTKAEVDAFMAALEGKKYIVSAVKTVDKIFNPRAPYTTSKLQQDAAIRLGFTSKKTMQLAQQLYDAQRSMSVSDIHISLAHEVPSDSYVYTSEEHNPQVERFLASPELILAGHYCGGVWRLPFLGAFYVPDKTLPRGGWFPAQEDVSGLSTVGESQVYITKGLSTSGSVPLMPFRLFNSPEISVLTLTSTLPENMLEAG